MSCAAWRWRCQVLKAFEAAEGDVSAKAEELHEIAESYEKAKNLADKIRNAEVDINIQLDEYKKVRTCSRQWVGVPTWVAQCKNRHSAGHRRCAGHRHSSNVEFFFQKVFVAGQARYPGTSSAPLLRGFTVVTGVPPPPVGEG